jgi:copper chaperone CopZ
MFCLCYHHYQCSNGDRPTATVEADPKTKQVKIETQQPETTVKNAIAAAGYTIA